MTRFWDEVRIISRTAWFFAAVAYAGLAALLWEVAIPHGQHVKYWPVWCQVLFTAGISVSMFFYVLLIGYICSDAKRRGMRHVMWTLLAIFIPNSIGVILYFVLRDPLPVPCPTCGVPSGPGFAFCPKCGAELSPACPSCRRAVQRDWANCAYCGAKTKAIAPANSQ